ncbi:hypothetical protein ACRAKI_18735 [Saccharothrix isguenensis]
MFRRPLLLTVALALLTGVTALVVVFPQARHVTGVASPYCTALRVLFDADEQMRRVAEELRDDPRVREVRDERTKADNHRRLTAELREAGRDDLADDASVDHIPASLRVVEAFGVDASALADELRLRHRVNHVDVCENPEVLQEGD